jgi:hypothetical protein
LERRRSSICSVKRKQRFAGSSGCTGGSSCCAW